MRNVSSESIETNQYLAKVIQITGEKNIITNGPLSLQYTRALNLLYKKEEDQATGLILETHNDSITENYWKVPSGLRKTLSKGYQSVGMLYGVSDKDVKLSDVIGISDVLGQMTNDEKSNSAIIIDGACQVVDRKPDSTVSPYSESIFKIAYEHHIPVFVSLEEFVKSNTLKASIKSIFEEECAGLKIDHAFYKKICDLEARFVNKKQEHIEFFGGSLTGVHTVRFTDEDKDRLFIDILGIDDVALEERLHALPDINKAFFISSNVFNITCVWIMHAFDTSIYLSDDEKFEGKLRICMYLQYKFLTSILFRFFPYPADPEVAAATYAQLSYKYVLKQQGSWGAALQARAHEVVAPHSIHINTIKKLDDDYRVVTMLNDVQGRIKDMIKNIMSLHMRINAQGIRISSSNSLVETDGEMILKDKTKSIGIYIRYLRTIIPDTNSFIRQELVDVIANIMQTMPPKLLHQTLKWLSTNYGHINTNGTDATIDIIMEHAFEYLAENKELLRSKNDLPGLLSKIRGAYMSSRSSNDNLLRIRKEVDVIVKTATKSKNESVIAAVRTGFCLYLILRSFTRDHYSNK